MNANVRLLRPQETVRFARLGDWLVDLPSNRLVRGERELRPTPKAMAVLRQLMLAGGAPITRNDLLERVWRDAYPTDDVLTHAVTELRRALEDDPRVPRYIETIPKVGYRLLPTVEWLDRLAESNAPGPPEESDAAPAPALAETPPQRPWALIAAVALMLLLALLLPRLVAQRDEAGAAAAPALAKVPQLSVKPVTSDPSSEQFPAISPDGSTVAYMGMVSEDGMSRIFIRGLNGSAPIALTRGKAVQELYPVWSPDGTQVALVRQLEKECRLVVVAALGGFEREAAPCTPGLVDYFDWGPDGKSLIVTRMQEGKEGGGTRLHVVDLETGAMRLLDYEHDTTAPDVQPRVSPDGRHIAFRRGAVPYSDIFVVDATGGAVHQLTHLRARVLGYDWLPDGRHMVLSSDHDGRQQLYLLDTQTRALSALGITGAVFPAAARKRPLVVYQWDNSDLNLVSIKLDGSKEPAQTLAPSTRAEYWPAYAPNDDRLVFVSDRSGEPQLWLQPAEAAAPFQLTHHHGLDLATPNWSPDGRRVVYVARGAGRSDMYVAEVDSGQSRRVSDVGENVRYASFSADGAWLLYVSDRSEGWQAWRRPLAGGPAQRIGHATAFSLGDVGDGRIYLTHVYDGGLYGLDPQTGEETLVHGPNYGFWNMLGWRLVRGGYYLLGEAPTPAESETTGAGLYFWPFSGGPPALVGVFPSAMRDAYFSVSHDGKRVVTAVLARDDTDVMQVDLAPLLGG